ncbi:MAG: AbrB/MazE/SpoVT family DNA-binding domain-containing protein [Pseudomonadota bacterium]|nr:AbrB/MazE/SpoVT family DNA-binding domain-containing protein [Pseudomonadota bacterium]
MKVSLVAIGNSRGVRLPSAVIRECGFTDEIEMKVTNGSVVLSPVRSGRSGWDAAFALMAAEADDAPLLDEGTGSSFDKEEWTW